MILYTNFLYLILLFFLFSILLILIGTLSYLDIIQRVIFYVLFTITSNFNCIISGLIDKLIIKYILTIMKFILYPNFREHHFLK
jgi:hypothetical protein